LADASPTIRNERPLVLVTLFGGGWHREMNLILERLPANRMRFAYAYGYFGDVHGAGKLDTPHPGMRWPIRFLGPTRKQRFHRVRNAWHLLVSCVEAFRIVRRARPDVILGISTASTAGLFLAGRIFGAKCIYVESLTRVERLSLTGRILYHSRLAHVVYAQWPQLRLRYPRVRFAGAVL
jgi:UDP-N-acetylglucosamine:LPS N-acetylglucosamine transferase